ncbi:MAG: hypothetical protein ACRD3M_03570 [Thermoanaerobaculia bacterium]
MPRASPVQDDKAREIFARLRGLIRTTLLTCYRLSPEEADGAEEDLLAWFLRLAKRGGGSQTLPEKSLRLTLLSAACQYGRSLQMWKLGGRRCPDQELNDVLSREPEELALYLQMRFGEEST